MNPLGWVGDSKQALLDFPPDVIREVGHALYLVQTGGIHPRAKPLKGFGGAGVVETIEAYAGDAYRVVYTVRFRGVI